MPIQEALVWKPEQLAAPDGVSFEPPCKTKDQDIKIWNDTVPHMAAELGKGRYIMVLVQTRNTRTWSPSYKRYLFNPPEDYIIAAYSVSSSLGKPYQAGTVAYRWLDQVKATSDQRTMGLDADMIHIFQCSSQGCNLSTVGLMKLITFKTKAGAGHAEAMSFAKDAIGNREKFGWRGGAFPGLESVETGGGRMRSSAFSAPKPRMPGLLGGHRG